MGDWTSQNWTKRDRRNNQEHQEQQQEKKAMYKTAAELAVKNVACVLSLTVCNSIHMMNHIFSNL